MRRAVIVCDACGCEAASSREIVLRIGSLDVCNTCDIGPVKALADAAHGRNSVPVPRPDAFRRELQQQAFDICVQKRCFTCGGDPCYCGAGRLR